MSQAVHHKEDAKQPAHYAFEYGVHDEHSGADFGHNEKRDGYATSGSYTVLLPDGRTQGHLTCVILLMCSQLG